MRYVSLLFLICFFSNCSSTKLNTDKIKFDWTTIDEQGLDKGQVSVDYEYCIPNDPESISIIRSIDEDVQIVKGGKSRIGCREHQNLCISNTHDPEWKKQLTRISNLNFIERIERTYYE